MAHARSQNHHALAIQNILHDNALVYQHTNILYTCTNTNTWRTPGRKTITRSQLNTSGVKSFQSYAMEKMMHGRYPATFKELGLLMIFALTYTVAGSLCVCVCVVCVCMCSRNKPPTDDDEWDEDALLLEVCISANSMTWSVLHVQIIYVLTNRAAFNVSIFSATASR